MFEITINGKPVEPENFEHAIIESAVEIAKEIVIAAISEEEASKITIDIIGTDLTNLSLNIKGPGEIVDKINEALS